MSAVGFPQLPSESYSGSSSYSEIFHTHRLSVQSHLKGQLNNDEPLLPSYLPPTSYWTAEEKDLFFHGLSIYSRLRPDLIAAHINTKNTIEVCLYLHCLQAAATENCDVISEGTGMPINPPAMELSEKWIRQEEILAGAVKGHDSCSWRADSDGVQAQSKCTCPAIGIDASGSFSKANAYLNHLDSICLTTQETIIREPLIKSQDMRLQSQMDLLEENAEGGPSNYGLAQDLGRLDNIQNVDKSSALLTPRFQNMVENDDSLINDKILQRQLKKRLYMRRKRAEKSGKPVDPVSIRLRPGREKKIRKPSKPRPKKYSTKNKVKVDSDAEDEDNMYEPHSKSGTTRPYRLKNFFQENGIDAQMLSDMDLDLFHLSTVARLLRLFNSINDPESSPDTVSISARTIQLFSDVTREFLSEIIRRAVVTKEQEIRMKRMMPVWKYERDEVRRVFTGHLFLL
ncbi:hypothetical protein HYPSUDRAFT_842557 [Hypholoma sublateritium FD-334 SS-4]|uniref:Myb-like domain-containing protein n=1 Tax=Hypholoma sublateritium (strain FD-334 SS-4) TaxID=945553 RepID=A0A0D2KZK4_HYPSF|nr:hypothetical protein HYPSUDRAFT_842557 [Hypholoma sublateritium FD-334 SS-4]